jgi:hypothetical protein
MIEINGATPTQYDPTSLTAEAYGCFYILRHLISNLDKTFYTNNILILLDNTTLINCITTAKLYPPTPTQCLLPEHDTIHLTSELLKFLPNVQLKHIKAHQPDETSYDNSLINRCHRSAQTAHNLPIPVKTIARLPNQQATHLINNCKISANYIDTIQQVTSTPALHQYYNDKFQWTPDTISSIDWKSHRKALNLLRRNHRKMIIQFNYRWPPLNDSHSVQAIGQGRCCPYCMNEFETRTHFLSCYHPTAISQWSSAAQELQTKLKKHSKHFDANLLKLIILAFVEWQQTPNPPLPPFLPQRYHQLFQQSTNPDTLQY